MNDEGWKKNNEGWKKNDEGWMKNDKWLRNDGGWWFQAVDGFWLQTDRQTNGHLWM